MLCILYVFIRVRIYICIPKVTCAIILWHYLKQAERHTYICTYVCAPIDIQTHTYLYTYNYVFLYNRQRQKKSCYMYIYINTYILLKIIRTLEVGLSFDRITYVSLYGNKRFKNLKYCIAEFMYLKVTKTSPLHTSSTIKSIIRKKIQKLN